MSEMISTGKVAMLALLLHEAARNRHLNAEAHLDDLVCVPGCISLATLAAGTYFGEAEWVLSELLYEQPPGSTIVSLAADLYEADEPLLAEAFLHAAGKHGQPTRAEWAQPYMQRWRRVRKTIAGYRGNGVAISMGDVTLDAHEAYKTQQGIDTDELLERYPPLPRRAIARMRELMPGPTVPGGNAQAAGDGTDEGPICPSCNQVIPTDRFELHLDGLDGAHPECPRTDLVEVVERARAAANVLHSQRRSQLHGQPFSRGWF